MAVAYSKVPPASGAEPEVSATTPSDREEWWRRVLAVTALVAGAAYLCWRWGWTLRWGTVWLGLPLVLAETWALASVALFVFSAWRLTRRTVRPVLDGASVCVLIPTYNEPAENANLCAA